MPQPLLPANHMLIRYASILGLLAGAVITTGCELTSASQRETSPLLRELHVRFNTRDPGQPINAPPRPPAELYLEVHGVFNQMAPGVIPSGRSVLEIEASSGDKATRLPLPGICTKASGLEYSCNKFSVGLTNRQMLTPVASRVASIDGHITYVRIDTSAVFVYLEKGDVFDAVARARKWPGVRHAELSPMYYLASTSLPASGPVQVAYYNLAGGTPVPGDGILQVRPGDTIWVRYPGDPAAPLEAVAVVPSTFGGGAN